MKAGDPLPRLPFAPVKKPEALPRADDLSVPNKTTWTDCGKTDGRQIANEWSGKRTEVAPLVVDWSDPRRELPHRNKRPIER